MHLVRATGLLARDERIPRPLRALAAFGALPIPGPIDELVLLLVAPIFATFYRDRLREAWRMAGAQQSAADER